LTDQKLIEVRTQFVNSVSKAVINSLLDDLLEEKVLNDEEVEEVREQHNKKSDQARTLIDGVRRKGSKASSIFIKCLQCRDGYLAEQLGLQAYFSGVPASQLLPAPSPSVQISEGNQPMESDEWITPCPLHIFQKIRSEEALEIYPIKDQKTRTRLALIICNIDFDHYSKRCGAEVDVAEMKRLLEGLGYRVETESNLSSQGMADSLKQFAARKEHKESDSTFLVLMSHGVKAGLCGTKSQDECTDILSLDTVYQTFNNMNCEALMGKPKVIIIQACRGVYKGYAYVSDSVASSHDVPNLLPLPAKGLEYDAIRRVHVESDFICFYSTTPDTVSWRHPETGSLFITHLKDELRQNAYRYSLEEIFQKVQLSFQDKPLHMPTKERATLMKKFYLFPGH
uniref:Caspase-1 n=1 Tax=Sphenodon punctatus TaxID=8508 RepID=A0A8D0G3W5_SPHPU